jgi:FG-GAP-like repeat
MAAIGIVAITFACLTAPPAMATATTAPIHCGGNTYYAGARDYDGDGYTDLVVGLPGANHGTGAVEIVRNGRKPLVYAPGTDGIPALPAGSRFGATTAAVDLNRDDCDDLLVGVPAA